MSQTHPWPLRSTQAPDPLPGPAWPRQATAAPVSPEPGVGRSHRMVITRIRAVFPARRPRLHDHASGLHTRPENLGKPDRWPPVRRRSAASRTFAQASVMPAGFYTGQNQRSARFLKWHSRRSAWGSCSLSGFGHISAPPSRRRNPSLRAVRNTPLACNDRPTLGLGTPSGGGSQRETSGARSFLADCPGRSPTGGMDRCPVSVLAGRSLAQQRQHLLDLRRT